MRFVWIFLILGVSLTLFLRKGATVNETTPPAQQPELPAPTSTYSGMENEHELEERKEHYQDLIHGNNPEIDWRRINADNFQHIHEQRAEMRSMKSVETFANGAFEAEWVERGSNNLAGNVQISAFDTATNSIYAISDGGTLWKSNLAGNSWTPLNEDIQLDSRVLQVFYLPGGTLRIVAARGHGIFYSDNEGTTWTQATGFTADWKYGSAINLVRLNDGSKTLVYLYNAYNFGTSDWQNRLAYSVNNGNSWTIAHNFTTSSDIYTSLTAPAGSSRAYILDQTDNSYIFEAGSLTPVSTTLGLPGFFYCQLVSNMTSTDTTLYALMDKQNLYRSTNGGNSFTFVSALPTFSWEVGVSVSIDDPDVLYYGEMELYRSTDGGLNFTKVNDWWDYYGDMANKIHADIMSISSFKTSGGTEFTLIPNHGGLYISYDHLATVENIGMLNLNVGQFYDVLTSTINSNYIFGGTQDQGFQRSGTGNSPVSSSFEQIISGDYGHMQLSNNGMSIWIQYPGAEFAFYPDAINDPFESYWYGIDGNDMPNYDWIVPTEHAPNPSSDFILVGGGEIGGGSGSHLIKLTNSGSTATPFQYSFDFTTASGGGTISAIGVTPLDPNKWYVATDNGYFFHSENAGSTWTQTPGFTGPEGNWIYGADIYASKLTPGLVFMGGSGYTTDAVYMSTDGGLTMTGIWPSSLPETAVHEMCMDTQELYLFAATDAGPYVYVIGEDEWYSLLGLSAPVQEYTTVEYVESQSLVRFGTWGRGIWDLKIQSVSGIPAVEAITMGTVFPNPSSGKLTLEANETSWMAIYDLNGRQVFKSPLNIGLNEFNLDFLTPAVYVVTTLNTQGIVRKQKWTKA